MTDAQHIDAVVRFNAYEDRRYNSATLLRVVGVVRQLDADNFPARNAGAALVHLSRAGINSNLRTVHLAQRIRRALAGVQPSGSN